MEHNEIKEAIFEAFKAVNEREELKAFIMGELFKAVNDDRWITIHPHGEDSDDYRRLKIKDGETVEEAMHRQGYYNKRKAKDEKALKDELKQLYQDILKAKKDGDKERHHKLLQKYNEIEAQLKGKKPEKEKEKETEEPKKTDKATGNGLLPDYASEFFQKQEKMKAAQEKWHKILADLQKKAETDKTFIEFQKQIDEIYTKMHEIKTYNAEFQALINEKNKILEKKNEYSKKFYKEAYAAQHEYTELDTSTDKKDIIRKMSGDIKNQISKISKSNDALVSKFEKLDTSEYDSLKAQDKKFDEQQNDIVKQMRELDYSDPKRIALRAQFSDIAIKRGEITKKQRELQYKTALQIGKILQVENGVKLDTKCSEQMQDITDKLKACLDGVIPSTNFNNKQMTVRKHEGRAFQSGSTINISSKEKIETAIHETMHHLEEHSEHVLMNSLAFAASRTGDEKQESLKRLTGLNYKRDEVCKKDKFFNPYCGKLYDAFGGKNKTFSNATASEIMSMGVQELFTNPKEFAKNDREYFDFVVANLQGKLWA